MTYTLLNAVFLAIAAIVVLLAHRKLARAGVVPRWSSLIRTGVLVVLDTAIFDNVIIAAGIVDYAPQHILGIHVALAPIEDFAYAIAAVSTLPAVWVLLPASAARKMSR